MRVKRTAWGCAAAALLCGAAPAESAERELRVCSDPNNLPFSNEAGQGFENALAELIASELDAEVAYTWWAQRRGFIRNTIGAGDCDVVMGVPAGYELVETTRPYYRSTYVFVYSDERAAGLEAITDPRLATLNIGVHLTGDDGLNPPPAHALGARGIVDNVFGYMIYGDYREPNPASKLIDAVVRGEIDVAAVWGPIGGYFAQRLDPALTVVPIAPVEGGMLPFEFSIAMGVRRGETELRDELDAVLERRRGDVQALLETYGVPLIGLDPEDDGAPTRSQSP